MTLNRYFDIIKKQAKADFQATLNPNISPEQRLKLLETHFCDMMITGLNLALDTYKEFTPLRSISPMYDEINAIREDLKAFRKNL